MPCVRKPLQGRARAAGSSVSQPRPPVAGHEGLVPAGSTPALFLPGCSRRLGAICLSCHPAGVTGPFHFQPEVCSQAQDSGVTQRTGHQGRKEARTVHCGAAAGAWEAPVLAAVLWLVGTACCVVETDSCPPPSRGGREWLRAAPLLRDLETEFERENFHVPYKDPPPRSPAHSCAQRGRAVAPGWFMRGASLPLQTQQETTPPPRLLWHRRPGHSSPAAHLHGLSAPGFWTQLRLVAGPCDLGDSLWWGLEQRAREGNSW